MHPNPQPASNGRDVPAPIVASATSGKLVGISFAVTLPSSPTASTFARTAIRNHLDEVLPAATLDDVLLAVSELVTNAVLHGIGQIELRITGDSVNVTVEVTDEGSSFERQVRNDDGLHGVGGKGPVHRRADRRELGRARRHDARLVSDRDRHAPPGWWRGCWQPI